MNITLKLYCDQSGAKEGDIASTTWEMFFEGKPFPSAEYNLLRLGQAHAFANRLLDMEDEAAK
jgi:hypothetical protein